MGFLNDIRQKIDDISDVFSQERERERARKKVHDGPRRPRGNHGGPQMGGGGAWRNIRNQTDIHHELRERFKDYENMDDYSELSSALDTYADEATKQDMIRDRSLWAEAENENISADLNYLLSKQLEVDDELWEQARYFCKYGNEYGRIMLGPSGVEDVEPLPVALTRRVHDEYGTLAGFSTSMDGGGTSGGASMSIEAFQEKLKQKRQRNEQMPFSAHRFQSNSAVFEPWEVSHFRLKGKDRMSLYGYGVLEPVRKDFRRLTLMEESVMVHKLTRAPNRYVYYVNTGEMPEKQAMDFVRDVRDMYKRKKVRDPQTGKMDYSYNPLAHDEDIFIPTGPDGDTVRVDNLSGADYQGMEDTQYFNNKIGRGIKIPSFAQQGQSAQSKPMTQEDIRFASAIMRVQRGITAGYKKICAVHLLATGRDYRDFDFDLYMTMPSAILELARIEVLSAKADMIQRMERYVSVRWMLVNLLGFSDDEAMRLMVMREEEKDYEKVGEVQRDLLRDVEREKAMQQLREHDESEIADKLMERWERKDQMGAFGVNEQQFADGPDDDIDGDALLREIRDNHKDIYERLGRLKGLLDEIQATGKIRQMNLESQVASEVQGFAA